MGAGGDGIPIDPDDLIPYLGHRQGEHALGGWAGSRPVPCHQPHTLHQHPVSAGGPPGQAALPSSLSAHFADGGTKLEVSSTESRKQNRG